MILGMHPTDGVTQGDQERPAGGSKPAQSLPKTAERVGIRGRHEVYVTAVARHAIRRRKRSARGCPGILHLA